MNKEHEAWLATQLDLVDKQQAEIESLQARLAKAEQECEVALYEAGMRLAEAEADVKRYRWIAAAPRDRASLEWIENKAELDAYIDAFLSPGNTDD